MGWQVANIEGAARPSIGCRAGFVCCQRVTLPTSGTMFLLCVLASWASSHPFGVDGCNCTAFIKGDATPWPPLLPPGFPCATRLKPHSATVHQSQSTILSLSRSMTACIFLIPLPCPRERVAISCTLSQSAKEPPAHLQACSVQGPTFACSFDT